MNDPDLSEFYAEQGKVGPVCSVRTALLELPPKEADKLRLALDTPRIQTAAIGKWLRKHGHALNESSIGRHRRGLCRCEKE